MNLLLVNDDGIDAKGIRALLKTGAERGHRVFVCAPAHQMSAASQRITLNDPICVRPRQLEGAVAAFAIAGTPTDCVRLAVSELLPEPVDVCLSGINDGYNAGMATCYSGTVGAAREATMLGLKAMAVSISHKASDAAIQYFADICIRMAEGYAAIQTPPLTVLNVNAPHAEPEQMTRIVEAPLSTANYHDLYIKLETPRSGTAYWMSNDSRSDPATPNSDWDMLQKGYITYSFLGIPQQFTGLKDEAITQSVTDAAR